MPKVSIIVPIYNVEKYLRECLDSLINQTLKDIEIICVDDGSKDLSPKIINEYAKKDKRIKVITKENSGYGNSMNRGLETAQGEYIGIVEPDDFVSEKMFEELYALASKNDLDIAKSDFYWYLSRKKQARRAGKIHKSRTGKILSVKDDKEILKIIPSIWSAIYKKSFLESFNIRFLETPGASFQDTSFAFKVLSAASRIMFTKEAYLYYRTDNDNSSVKSKGKIYAICDEYNEITDFLQKYPEIKQNVNDMKLLTQFRAYRWNLIRIDENLRDEFIDEFQKVFKEYDKKGDIDKNLLPKKFLKELELLLADKVQFRKYIDDFAQKHEKKEKRRKHFSIRINSSRISIVLFGRQVVEMG